MITRYQLMNVNACMNVRCMGYTKVRLLDGDEFVVVCSIDFFACLLT